jgi:hypothetical protein
MHSLEGVKPIPAMTTDAERALYYRLAKEAGEGAIVEFGAWLGASTAYIAAGIRDSGIDRKAQVYDKFLSKPGHARKVEAFYKKHGGAIPIGPSLQQFRANLGPMIEYVDVHPGQIEDLKWTGGPIAVLITDAPKRVPQISPVLTELREALQPGSIMAWQDFCHFPSYEIPACLYRLRHHIEFVEAVVPGTTLVFRVKSQWSADEVSLRSLSLSTWTTTEIEAAWSYWFEFVPQEKRGLFACGAAMFLCDIGHPKDGAELLYRIWADQRPEIIAKWEYLRVNRPDFVVRYAPLFKLMAKAA